MTIYKKHVFVCTEGKTCAQRCSEEILNNLRKQVLDLGLKNEIRINKAGCLFQCDTGPNLVVYPDAVWYANVQADDCNEIMQSHLLDDKPVERLMLNRKNQV